MNDEIKFACESCGQSVSVSSVHSGASLHCPSCGGSLTVPTVAPSSSSPRTGASEIAFKAEPPSQSYGVGDVVLKRYRLERILGRGGMGVVWLAEDEQLNEKVALKFVPPEIKQDKDALKDLRRETQKSRKLSHPNIIRIHDLNQSEGADPFISMEFVEGETVSSLRSKQPNGVFTWEALRPLAVQLGSALDYAHSQGIVHRDLKPANIMVTTSGQLKLADFGIAATISDTMGRVSLENLSSGTPTYMSPQQIEGFPPSARDDVYALGATLYDLLTTKPPFFRGKIIHQVLNVAPVPLEQRLEELGVTNPVPAEVSAAIMACLVKDSEQRPASAAAVMELLGLGVSSRPVNAPVVSTVSTVPTNEAVQENAPAPVAGRPRWLWGAVAGGVAAVVVIIAAVMMSGSKKDSGTATQPAALSTKQKSPSAGQPGAVSSPTLASTDKVIDLLALVDVKRDVIKGNWSRNGTDVVLTTSTGSELGLLEFTANTPEEHWCQV